MSKSMLLESVDQFMVSHRAWQANAQRPVVDTQYHQQILSLVQATEAELPAEFRALVTTIHTFHEAFNDYFVHASQPGFNPALGTAYNHEQAVWRALEGVQQVRELYDAKDPHMPSVAELRGQKVNDEQISRMWGVPLGMVEGLATGKEKLSEDHQRPDQIEAARVRRAKLRDANLEADLAATTQRQEQPVSGERLDDLIYQKISAQQIQMMRPADYPTISAEQVLVRAQTLGVQLPDYGTVAADTPYPQAEHNEEAFAATRRADREAEQAAKAEATPGWPSSELETFVVDNHKDAYGALKSGAVVELVLSELSETVSVQKVNGIMVRWKDSQDKARLREEGAAQPAA